MNHQTKHAILYIHVESPSIGSNRKKRSSTNTLQRHWGSPAIGQLITNPPIPAPDLTQLD